MQTQSRAAPHLLLGVLTVLALAAILLSLATAPPNAEQQLRQAARNTVGAASFMLVDTITVVPAAGASGAPRREVAEVVYESPDRVRESVTVNGRSLTVLAIGSARYERSGSGKWLSLGTRAGSVPAGQVAAQGVLEPLGSVSTATEVVRHGDRFDFVPGQRSALLQELLGSQGAQLPPGSTSFEAAVSGDYLSEFQMTARATGGQVRIHLELSSYGRAPALRPPPASEITAG